MTRPPRAALGALGFGILGFARRLLLLLARVADLEPEGAPGDPRDKGPASLLVGETMDPAPPGR